MAYKFHPTKVFFKISPSAQPYGRHSLEFTASLSFLSFSGSWDFSFLSFKDVLGSILPRAGGHISSVTHTAKATLLVFALVRFWHFLLPEKGCVFPLVKQMEDMKNRLGGGMSWPGCELQLTPALGPGSLTPLFRTQERSDGDQAMPMPFLSLSLISRKSQHGLSLRP